MLIKPPDNPPSPDAKISDPTDSVKDDPDVINESPPTAVDEETSIKADFPPVPEIDVQLAIFASPPAPVFDDINYSN